MNYTDFLKSKVVVAPKSGFAIDRGQLNPELKGHQKDAVQWAIAEGGGHCSRALDWAKRRRKLNFAIRLLCTNG